MKSKSLVEQLIYNELSELTDTIQQRSMRGIGRTMEDHDIETEIALYKADYPEIYNEVIEADYCRRYDI